MLFRLWSGGGILYSAHSDVIAMSAGLRALAQRSLAETGRLPLWDPACNAGTPAFASPIAQYAFPLEWLFRFLPLDRAVNWIFALEALLAGLGMHLFAARRLRDPCAAAFCAAAYMLSYRLLSQFDAGWLPATPIYALTPYFFLTLDRVLELPSRGRALALAVVLALGLVQGSPQGFYYTMIAALGFAAVRWTRSGRRETALALAGAALLAFLLAAPYFLPLLEFAALSTRTRSSYAFFAGSAPSWRALKTLIDPFDAGGARLEYWENNFYFGLTLYPLAALAVLRDWKRSRWLLASVLVCIALCFDSPILSLLYRALPGFRLFRLTSRLLTLAQFPFVLLAGVGLDRLLQAAGRRGGRRAALFAAAACIALAAFDSGARIIPRLTTVPLEAAFPEPAFFELLRRSPENGRVAALGRTAVPYGMAGYYGIDMINGYVPLNLRHYAEYLDVLQTGRARRDNPPPTVWTDMRTIARPDLLRALDVRSIVANRELPLDAIGYKPIGRRDGVPVYSFYSGVVRAPVLLWRDRRPLGPAFFASSLRAVDGEDASLDALASSPARDAAAFGWSPEVLPLDFAGGSVRQTLRGIDSYTYDIDSRGRNFLILSQIWYPGWRARLDGASVRLFRTDHALLGCVVPPGRHVLDLEMTSPPRNLGLALFALGLLTSLLALPRRGAPSR